MTCTSQVSVTVSHFSNHFKSFLKCLSLTPIFPVPVEVGSFLVHELSLVHYRVQVSPNQSRIGQNTDHFAVPQLWLKAGPNIHRKRIPLHCIVHLLQFPFYCADSRKKTLYCCRSSSTDDHQCTGVWFSQCCWTHRRFC